MTHSSQVIAATDENLLACAVEPMTRWLMAAALERRRITYSEVRKRLEDEYHLSSIFTTRLGKPAGELMNRLLEEDAATPLLNVLLVRSDTLLPGSGAGYYMAPRFGEKKLAEKDAPTKYPELWQHFCEKAAEEVYAYKGWPALYRRLYRKKMVIEPLEAKGTEKDGLARGRGGEGKPHRDLRLWVQANPGQVAPQLKDPRAETEVDLLSGDRVDVVYYGSTKTLGIEVKSRTSDWFDLLRGVYQCVKYRAVLKAQDIRPEADVDVLLVTETELDGELKTLARRFGVKHLCVPVDRD
ncbi:MAG: hypothetical protein NVV74_25300 [Magnetospirillum sp.]|nr:hypothetical protein [Magnetospirillum sp.]